MKTIHFKTKLNVPDPADKGDSSALITLQQDTSTKLPSRGMVSTEGSVNGVHFRVVMQPNGQGSHWFVIGGDLYRAAKLGPDKIADLEIKVTKDWPEPELTTEVKKALAADPQAKAMWTDITPMARWEWLNWMGSVKLPKTLQERPEKLCSMLKAGKRRPCCFNRSLQMPPKLAFEV